MGKGLLLIVAACSLGGGMVLYSIQNGNVESQQQLTVYQNDAVAQEVTRFAYQRAYRWVRNYWEKGTYSLSDTLTGSYQGGTYQVTVSASKSGDDLKAELKGRGQFKESERQINAIIGGRLGPQVPPFMRYAMMSHEDISLDGNALVTDNGTGQNADIHTNGSLLVDGKTNRVHGFGTYSGSKTISPTGAEDDIFKPNETSGNKSLVREVDPVDVPTFDLASYKNKAHKKTTGSVSWSGGDVIDFTSMSGAAGTQEDPVIWYIEEGLSITGDVTIKGYGMLVMEDSVKVSGSAVTSQDASVPGNMGIYAGGQISIKGGASIHGQIYSNQDIYFDGKAKVYGNLSAKGFTFLNGTPDLYYRSAEVALTQPIWQHKGLEEVTLNEYSEW